MIYEQLTDLRLHYLADNLDQFLLQANNSKWSLKEVFQRFIELEHIEKTNRSTQQRLKNSRIGKTKMMNQFDWSWPKKIDRPILEELLHAEFIKYFQNIVLAGPQGVGKTMIAKNIGLSAIGLGFKVLFSTASDLVIDLGSQESSAALQRRLKRYIFPDLLIIDELGYLSFDNRSADLLFDIISKRYEKGAILITTNLAFKDWGGIFGGAACVTALIDRLTHHCEILKIDSDSYRTHEAGKAKSKRGQANAATKK